MPATESAAGAIARVRYTHDAMIDMIIANPAMSQGEIAKAFGFTETWISRIFCSSAFEKRLAERKNELVDPVIISTIEERLKGLALQATDVIAEKLTTTKNADLAVKALELSSKALGFGARKDPTVQVNNYLVAMPPKIQNSSDWASAHSGGQVVELRPEKGE